MNPDIIESFLTPQKSFINNSFCSILAPPNSISANVNFILLNNTTIRMIYFPLAFIVMFWE